MIKSLHIGGLPALRLALLLLMTGVASDRPLLGREFFVTPRGNGNADGSNWSHASPGSELQNLISRTIRAGDTVLLGSGSYDDLPHDNNVLLKFERSGAPGNPIVIQGVDTGMGLPEIMGHWAEDNPRYHAHSACAVLLAPGVSHLKIRGLRIRDCMNAIRGQGDHLDLELDHLSISGCREGMIWHGLHHSSISNCQIEHYTKRGIRFTQDCRELILRRVTANATGGRLDWPAEAFPFGFSVEDHSGNRNIRFEECTARNNLYRDQADRYWNGDGFVAEANASGLTYIDCRALDNTDGGWDDKSLAPVLKGCIAMRNKRGFRLWNLRGGQDHPAQLTQCLAAYNESRGGIGSAVGLWLCGAVAIDRCTFHNNSTAAVAIENSKPGGVLLAYRSIFSSDQSIQSTELVLEEAGTVCRMEEVLLWKESLRGIDPQYVNAHCDWDGNPPDAFNSRGDHSGKGYRSTP